MVRKYIHVPNCKPFLKCSLSGDSCDFNNIETRAVIKFFPVRQGAEGNLRHSDRNISRTCTIVCHRQKLVRSVETCWFFHLCYASYLTIQSSDHLQIIDQIHDFILEDILISTKSIPEQLGIPSDWVRSIIHEDLDMRKLSAKWVLKYLQ